jgi:signal transduction histidine kinase
MTSTSLRDPPRKPRSIVRLLGDLVDPSGREAGARALAERLRVDQIVLFLDDEEAATVLPATGSSVTGLRTGAWGELVDMTRQRGRSGGQLPSPADGRLLPAVGRALRDGSAVVLLGGAPDDAAFDELCELLPLLTESLWTEQCATRASWSGDAHAGAATELRLELDAARRDLERARRSASQLAAQAALVADVGLAFAESGPIDRVLRRCCTGITEHLRADYATIWTFDAERHALDRRASTGASSGPDSERADARSDRREIALVAHHRLPRVTALARGPLEIEAWFAGYPITAEDKEILGVVAMRADGPIELTTLESLSAVADLVAVELNRRSTERMRFVDAESTHHTATQAAVQALENLLAIVSHDLRNPLSSVLNSSAILQRFARQAGDHRSMKPIDAIVQSAGRMKSFLVDLLDVADVDAGTLQLDRKRYDAAGLLREIVQSLEPIAARKGLRLCATTEPEGVLVTCDRRRLTQVLTSIVGNSIRFSERGEIILRASARDGGVEICVSDTGLGIPAEELPNVFDRFWRLDRGAPTGVGLGLAIAKGIVEAHDGTIAIQSQLGHGTSCTLWLPGGPSLPVASPAPTLPGLRESIAASWSSESGV